MLSRLLGHTARARETSEGETIAKSCSSNVQVTLEILRALIDKSPRDLPLYAPYVLGVLLTVLSSNDLTTTEFSVPTFQTFCEHQDTATLAADQELIGQYEQVVKHYARLAEDAPPPSKTPSTAPIQMRWRTAGLQSIKSITGSEAIAADGGKQVGMIVSTILENLHRHNEDQLLLLGQRVGAEKDGAVRRRMSIATVRTTESVPTANETVSATTADADRLAEEEVGLLALQSMISQGTPGQERFVSVVTAMETLIRSPTSEENLEKQLVLATLVESLLGSSVKMIGLSVMDVLL